MIMQLERRLMRCFQWVGLLVPAVLALVSASRSEAALEIRRSTSSDPGVVVVELSGAIERGDAQRVQAYLASLAPARQISVRLDSPGGSLDEALRAGRYLHSNGVRTEVVGKGRACLSACALMFLGGRDVGGAAWRVKGAEAELGFHAFRRVVADKEFTVADMQEAVASTQHSLLAIADYLTAIGADIEFMSMMLEKPTTEMNFMSNEKALQLGVHVLQERAGKLIRAQTVSR